MSRSDCAAAQDRPVPGTGSAARIVHKTTCAINSTGHRGPCTCGAYDPLDARLGRTSSEPVETTKGKPVRSRPLREKSAAQIYEFKIFPHDDGWHDVACRMHPGRHYETVAKVFGERRAEIVRDALSEEANERVE